METSRQREAQRLICLKEPVCSFLSKKHATSLVDSLIASLFLQSDGHKL
jgi:hypothetical protein